jgi:hypothetical protein
MGVISQSNSYKGTRNKKSVLLNKKRTIINQICTYLKYHHLIENRNTIAKEKDLINFFFSQIGHDIPTTYNNTWEYLFELYEDNNFHILKAHIDRPDIPPSTWKELRRKVFETWGKQCLKCNSKENIAVDHIKPYSLYPELIIEFNNLQPLCRSCNSIKGNRNCDDYRNPRHFSVSSN